MSDPYRRNTLSVGELVREVRLLLETSYPSVWVEGEISNLASPSSGHLYFSLKDDNAQIRCALFRNRRLQCACEPREGMQALVRGQVSLYEGRGDFQLIVHFMEDGGEGALRRAFEVLKRKLQDEGLFDPARKKPIPKFPKRIGIITSPTGAAIRDIISTFKRRCPSIQLLILPAVVQGGGAIESLVEMLENIPGDCDALILARGGGSLEDLWAFNEEAVIRAMAHCPIPIVTGIGHEIDFTIADFIADQRAPTPTAAAELLSPDRDELLNRLQAEQNRLRQTIIRKLMQVSQHLDTTSRSLVHPQEKIQQMSQYLQERQYRLHHRFTTQVKQQRFNLDHLSQQLLAASPSMQLPALQKQCMQTQTDLHRSTLSRIDKARNLQQLLTKSLENLSPNATLRRGYAIVSTVSDDRLLRDASKVKQGDLVNANLAQGRLLCSIDEVHSD